MAEQQLQPVSPSENLIIARDTVKNTPQMTPLQKGQFHRGGAGATRRDSGETLRVAPVPIRLMMEQKRGRGFTQINADPEKKSAFLRVYLRPASFTISLTTISA
ncbi:MAG: hypothetical protein WBO46_01235 [Caldilineaceae bacterium]